MSKKITGTQRHYYKNLLSIGIPIVIGQLGTIILGFADTIMIGHHSTEELAAAGLVNNIYTLVFVMYMGFTYGLTPIIGRLYGEERTDNPKSCSLSSVPTSSSISSRYSSWAYSTP